MLGPLSNSGMGNRLCSYVDKFNQQKREDSLQDDEIIQFSDTSCEYENISSRWTRDRRLIHI